MFKTIGNAISSHVHRYSLSLMFFQRREKKNAEPEFCRIKLYNFIDALYRRGFTLDTVLRIFRYVVRCNHFLLHNLENFVRKRSRRIVRMCHTHETNLLTNNNPDNHLNYITYNNFTETDGRVHSSTATHSTKVNKRIPIVPIPGLGYR